MLRRIVTTSIFILCIIPVRSQYSMGVSGLLNIPSADMQADGTFMAGANYLPRELMPERWDYNSGNYFLNITFLPFAEVAYRCTLIRGDFLAGNKWQQDRSVSLRLRPLKESKYLPAVVAGSNDTFTTNQLNPLQGVTGNRFFSSVYGVATKHLRMAGHDLNVSVGGFVPVRKQAVQQGVFAGAGYSPSFLNALVLMVEYDTNGINAGAAVRLFNHASIHLFAYDLKVVSGGIRYEFGLIH